MATQTCAISLGGRASNVRTLTRGAAMSVGLFFTASPYGSSDFSRGAVSPKAGYPGPRVPFGYLNGDRSQPIYIDPAWDRWMRHFWTDRLGGDSGPSMTEVQTNVIETKAQAVEAAVQVSAVATQAIANAEALAATVEVAKNNSLAGSTSIPPVVRRPGMMEP